MPDDELGRITSTMLDRKSALRRAAIASALNVWNSVAGVSDQDVREFVVRAGPTHRATLVTVTRLVDAHVDGFLRAHGEQPSGRPIDVDELLAGLRAGTTLEEEFERPFVEARTALSRGSTFGVAMGQAGNRLANIVATDVQQAYRTAMAGRLSAEPSIPGYRRVLTGPENCSLCVTASTVRYRSDKLMPIHPGCDCGVAPLEPGMAVTGAGTLVSEIPTLDQTKQLLRDEGVSYSDRARMTRLTVDPDGLVAVTEIQHGELGPVLAAANHDNTELDWRRRSRREFDAAGRLVRS